jgi:hypothetical protein
MDVLADLDKHCPPRLTAYKVIVMVVYGIYTLTGSICQFRDHLSSEFLKRTTVFVQIYHDSFDLFMNV